MTSRRIKAVYRCEHLFIVLFALEEIVNVLVADTVTILIGALRSERFQISSRQPS